MKGRPEVFRPSSNNLGPALFFYGCMIGAMGIAFYKVYPDLSRLALERLIF